MEQIYSNKAPYVITLTTGQQKKKKKEDYTCIMATVQDLDKKSYEYVG